MEGHISHLFYHNIEKLTQGARIVVVPFRHWKQHVAGENEIHMRRIRVHGFIAQFLWANSLYFKVWVCDIYLFRKLQTVVDYTY